MHPVLIKLGWFTVYSFGFMLALSFLIGIYLSSYRARRFGVDPQAILDLSVYVIISGVVGSRLLYVAFHVHEYRNLIDVFALWQGGATLYGGFLLAVFAGYVFSRKRNLGFLLLGDIMSPAFALGIALTRIGCFLSGCCFGKVTSQAWGVCFPPNSPAGAYEAQIAAARGLESVKLHPSQLYDSALGFLTVILLLSLQGRLVKRGGTFGLMLACYGTSRFIVDFSRFYEANMQVTGVFNLNQLLSVLLIAAGAYLLLRKDRGRETSSAGSKK